MSCPDCGSATTDENDNGESCAACGWEGSYDEEEDEQEGDDEEGGDE